MTDNTKSDEITRPVRVAASFEPGDNHSPVTEDASGKKQWQIPEWLIEFVQEPVSESDPAVVNANENVISDEHEEIAIPVFSETAEWQPLPEAMEDSPETGSAAANENETVEDQTDIEVPSEQNVFDANALNTLLINKDYAQLIEYLKPLSLNANDKALLVTKLRSHLLMDELSSCLWELYESLK